MAQTKGTSADGARGETERAAGALTTCSATSSAEGDVAPRTTRETARRPRILLIVGVQRSGTTLLRSILNTHPQISIGYECAFYRRLYDTYAAGVPCDERIDVFVDDLFAVKRFEHWGLDRDCVTRTLRSAGLPVLSYADAVRRIVFLFHETNKPEALYAGVKNPHGIYHLDFILDLFPDVRILHIIRDPRGILASEKKKRLKRRRYNTDLTIWTVSQRFKRMIASHRRWLDHPQYMSIMYSELVGKTQTVMEDVLNFLGCDTSDYLAYFDPDAPRADHIPESELWQHSLSAKATDASRINAFEHELTPFERRSIEALCGSEMAALSTETFDYRFFDKARFYLRIATAKAFGRGETGEPRTSGAQRCLGNRRR